ncbi:outer membrane protein assembly factor BamA [Phreatobacter stygius]|uniref:Outer membrane protein assembly factor BamA n=1 Tax=Phreatobacter stygius TaxID=1940610 RepID=A0A4D7BET6_9HYPH|nr:outer membrane protein assembly factor BamA [Phreatobacter stygius]QCI68428.1 outer membrane protein assembly factor BamA [Phreatobacter stygius]
MTFFARTVRTVVIAGTVVTSGVAAATLASTALSTGVNAQSASSIVVQGNRRIEADTVRSYFSTGPGEPLSAARVDEAIKAMYATGLFRDVRVSRQGGRLVVTVVENDVINRVVFEGNRRLKTEQLTNEIESRPRGTFSRATVQSDVQRLYDVYRRTGRYDVEIVPKTIQQPNGRMDLVFEINEGKKASVRAINFVGNNNFGRQRLLDVMSTGETGLFSWLRSNDVYDADRLNADQEALRRLYLRSGYVDMRVVSARADFDRAANAFTVTIEIEEGPQYRIGTVDVQSNIRDVDGAVLRRIVRTSPGGVYNVELVDKSLEDVTLEVARRGYAFAQVRPRGERDPSTLTVNLVYVVEEGPRVYVERINIRGNTRTQDRVVRREFDMAEGDAYNRVLVDRAERRLKNLGFFKNVKITTEPGSAADRVIVNVDVEDQPTGQFSISGGYSTSDGFIAEASVEERNFLGRGQFVRLGGTFGQRTQGLNFSFTEPYLLDYRLSGGFDLFWRHTSVSNYQSYASTSYGGTLRLGVPITENFAIQARYTAMSQRITLRQDLTNCYTGYNGNLRQYTLANGTVQNFQQGDPSIPAGAVDNGPLYNVGGVPSLTNPGGAALFGCLDDGEASAALRAIDGRSRFISMLGYSLIYSNLDRAINPSQGVFAELRQDVAGIGGDAKFVRTTGELRYYHDLTNDWILMLRGQAGNIFGWGSTKPNGGKLDSIDQFFMGPELVRGFQTAGIGPRDFATAGMAGRLPDAVGGTSYWGASAEVTFPITFLPKDFGMRGALYADAGAVWGYNSVTGLQTGGGVLPVNLNDPSGRSSADHVVRSSVGVGLLWNSPFGPIRFDYSFVLSKAQWDRTQFFRFSGGTRF